MRGIVLLLPANVVKYAVEKVHNQFYNIFSEKQNKKPKKSKERKILCPKCWKK